MKQRAAIIALIAVLLVAAAVLLLRAPSQSAQPIHYNILVIVVDTLRPDHLSCYGYERDTSPNIDRLAGESVLFEEARSTSSWTLPAMMSMFTGRNCRRHGVLDYRHSLTSNIPILAGLLREHGYATIGVVSTPTLEGRFGFARGFDTYDDQSYKMTYEDLEDFGSAGDRLQASRDMVSSPLITRLASNWINRLVKKEKPWYLFVHYMDPHFNYLPPAPYNTMYDPDYKGSVDGRDVKYSKTIRPGVDSNDLRHLIALYDGEIRHNDEQLGELLQTLRQSGQYDNTIIVLTADHGEEFLEHGSTAHGETLYDEVVRIPLIIRMPGQTARKRKDPVSLVDVFPTLCQAVGIKVPEGLDGLDLAKEIPPRRTLLLDVDVEGHITALLRGDQKLIINFEKRTLERYDLSKDREERVPLPDATVAHQGMKEEILRYRESGIEPIRRETSGMDDQTLEEIKNLGYVQ